MNQKTIRPPASANRYVVARTSEIMDGDRILVQAGGREIGIYNVDGQFYALLNRCPHLGGPLCKGQVVTDITSSGPGDVKDNPGKVHVTCPWHNWEFDIQTGQSYWNPKGLRARPFPVDVKSGEALMEAQAQCQAERTPGHLVAETIPVSIEDNYIVVSLRPASAEAKEKSV